MNIGKRYLAIDYGEKRVGIAITDPLKMFAYPLVTIKNDKNFWSELNKIFAEYEIEIIVLGYPLKENGEHSKSTEMVEKFYDKLVKKTSIVIEYFDERYSSMIAKEKILQSVSSRKKRRDKSLIDKNAAAVILNDFMQSKNY